MAQAGVSHDGATLFRQLGEFIQSEMERLGVPGVAVGVQYGGEEYLAGFGVTSITNPLPVDGDTIFQIGSTTKTFTATAVMRLVEEGKLDLDTPVRRYIPSLELESEETAARVTLRHLFNHTGGWLGDYFDDAGPGDDARAKIVERMVDLPQLTPLGEVWSYNNAAFYIAGRVLEIASGKTYEQAIQDLIFTPLGMDRSFLFPEDAMVYRFAVGHIVGSSETRVALPWGLTRATYPAGAIASTARDQLRYARFQMGDGTTPSGERLLQRATMDEMQAPTTPAGSNSGAVGITWMVNEIDGTKLVRHGGATNGQMSAFLFAPEHGFAITVLTNANRGVELHGTTVDWALKEYLGLVEPEPPLLERSAEQLAEYAGRYHAALSDLDLSVEDGMLVLQATPRGGFPKPDSKPGETPPPTRLSLHQDERVIGLDAPYKGARGEFLRDANGDIEWFRFGGRIAKRER
jgi:CubicO group peptidase (beta-lactamase class C family)